VRIFAGIKHTQKMHNVYFKRMPTGKCKNFLQAIYILPATRKCKKQGKKCRHWTTVPCPNVVNGIHSFGRALFVCLISHQPAVLFSQNKPAIASSQQYFSLRTNQHQPSATSQTNRLKYPTLGALSSIAHVPGSFSALYGGRSSR
jgi:hypothetical protein